MLKIDISVAEEMGRILVTKLELAGVQKLKTNDKFAFDLNSGRVTVTVRSPDRDTEDRRPVDFQGETWTSLGRDHLLALQTHRIMEFVGQRFGVKSAETLRGSTTVAFGIIDPGDPLP